MPSVWAPTDDLTPSFACADTRKRVTEFTQTPRGSAHVRPSCGPGTDFLGSSSSSARRWCDAGRSAGGVSGVRLLSGDPARVHFEF